MSWDDIKHESKESLKEGYGIFTHGFRDPFIEVTINRNVAVNYARNHCGDTASRPNNPDFPYLGDDKDCTNFVAQCWNAAGLSAAYDFYCDGAHTNSYNWIHVDDFLRYVTSHGIARLEWSSIGIKPGDIIQFRYRQEDGSEAWLHSALITDTDGDGGLYYTCHSKALYNLPLSAIYYCPEKTSITEIRFIVPLHPTYYIA